MDGLALVVAAVAGRGAAGAAATGAVGAVGAADMVRELVLTKSVTEDRRRDSDSIRRSSTATLTESWQSPRLPKGSARAGKASRRAPST